MKTLRSLLFALAMLGMGTATFAQSTAPRFSWTQDATTAAVAQSFVYKIYGAGANPVTLANVVCTGAATPFTCTAPIVTLPSGTLALKLTTTAGLLESQPSTTFQVIVPSSPVGLNLIP